MRYILFISVTALVIQYTLCNHTNLTTENLKQVLCILRERIEPSKELAVAQFKNGLPLENDEAENEIISARVLQSATYKLTDDQVFGFYQGSIEGSKVFQYSYVARAISITNSNATNTPDKNATLAKLEEIGDRVAPYIRLALDEIHQFNTTEDCLKAINEQVDGLKINETYEIAAMFRFASIFIDTCLSLNCKVNQTISGNVTKN